MNIPSKIKKGDQFSSKIIDVINGIIDYLGNTRPVQGDGIRLQHTATGIIVNSTAQSNLQKVVDPPPYYGDFCIIDLSKYDSEGKILNVSVAVAHGWTWNPEEKYSRYSAVLINDHLFCCSSKVFENLSASETYYLYVKVSDYVDDDEITVECSSSALQSTEGRFFYEIGQIIEGKIIQTHRSGALILYRHWRYKYR